MKRSLSLVLAAALLCMAAVPVSAAVVDNTVQPRWVYIASIEPSLDINWVGLADCEGKVTAASDMSVKVLVRLQQYTDSGWSTLRSWSATGAGTAYASGIYAVHSGYTYRVYVTAYVYDANGNILEAASTSDTFVY